MTVRNKLYILLALIGIWLLFFRDDHVSHGPGVMAPDPPVQEEVDDVPPFTRAGVTVTPLARFEIEARVLSREDYSWGPEADVSPMDLALGWGNMSDESVLAFIDISQSGRWYHWRTSSPPIALREIERSSANMHLIPADVEVEAEMERIRRGDLVEIRGYLVRVDWPGGRRWISSLSRNDVGANACELIWVEYLAIRQPDS